MEELKLVIVLLVQSILSYITKSPVVIVVAVGIAKVTIELGGRTPPNS